jgi:hypothetical protein
MTDKYDRWRRALKGEKLDMGARGNPPLGYYRRNAGPKGWEAVAVFHDDDGVIRCERNIFGDGSNMTVEQIDELFASEIYAIPYEVYEEVSYDGKAWPPEHTARLSLKEIKAGIGMTADLGRAKTASATMLADNERAVAGDNSKNAKPHELLAGRLNDLSDERKAWLESIGGAIATQEQADRAAAFSEAFAKLEKEAIETHKVEKEPHLKAGREVDATWKPVINLADDGKRSSKALLTPFLRKKDEEAKKAARKAAMDAAAKQEPVVVEPVKPKAVNGGRGVTLRTVRSTTVTDLPKLAAYLAGMANPAPEFVEACRKLADKALKAGVDVPGAKIIESQEAA